MPIATAIAMSAGRGDERALGEDSWRIGVIGEPPPEEGADEPPAEQDEPGRPLSCA